MDHSNGSERFSSARFDEPDHEHPWMKEGEENTNRELLIGKKG